MDRNIFLLLGSNEGAPAQNIASALGIIEKNVGTITGRSSLYRSAAWGLKEQPDFYNQVVEITSSLPAEELLAMLLEIELQMGRIRRVKWGPRIIDIDLLFYGSEVIDTIHLRVPHPGIPARRFTLLPLAELAPDFVHPVLRKSIATLLDECVDVLAVDRV